MKTLIDINEVAKSMTREEFINQAKEPMMGKINECGSCPEKHRLISFYNQDKCKPFKNCKECWSNAVKDIKFKDDMEVEKVSKKLNIIEAMKMPIGSIFEVYSEGIKSKLNAKIVEVFNSKGKKALVWDNRAYIEVIVTDSSMTATFIPIQQPVSFMEVVNSNKRCRVESNIYTFDKYFELDSIMHKLSSKYTAYDLRTIIKEGKWYIEESEELEDERLSK